MEDVDLLLKQLKEQKMKVDFNTYDLSIKELISMVTEGIINIAPEYQRQFRWDTSHQSNLVESIFLGIPLPTLFMATNNDGSWELVDGVQRVSSIICFAGSEEDRKVINQEKALTLVGLKKIDKFNNKSFAELPMATQLNFKLSSIKVTTLSDKSDLNVRFDLFERLNKGGVSLTDQEIRSCVYRGKFNDFIKEMSKNEDFKNCIYFTDNEKKNGTSEELVLRFFAYFENYNNFDHSVVDFLNKYMENASERFSYEKNERVFRYVFKELNKALPMKISKGRKSTPKNLYEAVSVGAALAYEKNGYINVEGIQEWIQSRELVKYTTGATNVKSNVINRITFCEKRFEKEIV